MEALERERKSWRASKDMPKLRISELANIPERPQFQLSNDYRAAMSRSKPTAQHNAALIEGSSSVSADSPRGIALPSARRVRVLQNGKTQLEATHVNINPIFRESKPLSLSSDASAAAALRAAPQSLSCDVSAPVGPAASSSESGEDEGTDHNKLLKGLMLMLNSENLADMGREFGKYKQLDVAEFVDVMARQLSDHGSPEERAALVAKLAQLFSQVDVNGDQRMEWSELTSYIVQTHAAPEPPMPQFHEVPLLLDQSRLRSCQTIERLFYIAPLDLLLMSEAPQLPHVHSMCIACV